MGLWQQQRAWKCGLRWTVTKNTLVRFISWIVRQNRFAKNESNCPVRIHGHWFLSGVSTAPPCTLRYGWASFSPHIKFLVSFVFLSRQTQFLKDCLFFFLFFPPYIVCVWAVEMFVCAFCSDFGSSEWRPAAIKVRSVKKKRRNLYSILTVYFDLQL